MIKTLVIPAAALMMVVAGGAGADDLTDAAQALCESVKSCALEQIVEQDLTDEMREMMVPMLDNMCASMSSMVQEVPVGHGLYDPAVSCMRSLGLLSCAQMQDPDRVMTSECRQYEKLVRESGVAPQQ